MKSKISYTESIMRAVFLLCACISILAVSLICLFLLSCGVPAIAEIGVFRFLAGPVWEPQSGLFGIFPMIVGSLYATALSLAFGIPAGVLTSVFMACFCPAALYRVLKPTIELAAAIPSVVYGLFGLTVIAPLIRGLFGGTGSSLLAASAVLGIMILPTVTSVCEASIRAVPKSCYEGSRALGASHELSVFRSVLPAAGSGVLAGTILATGRAVGETMAVVMVAGNSAVLPRGLLKSVRTLTGNIVLEMGYAEGLHREALIATAVVLFVFVLLINLSFSALKRRNNA